jgi:hypothetical protein
MEGPMGARHFEIVRVTDDASLLDGESYQGRYRRAGGRALAPGYYVVIGPASIAEGAFGEDAEFIGPLESMLAAECALCDVGLGAAWARLVA